MSLLVSDLRALAVGVYGGVLVFGNSALDDGGGGLYYWDAGASNTDDGAEWVKPTSVDVGSPGRWHRIEPYALPTHTHSGTYQAQNTQLTALAGTTSTANALPYFTGSGAATTTTLSAFGRSLIDDADAAAVLATLGVSGTNRTPQTQGTATRSSSPADAGYYVGWTSTASKTYTVDASTLTLGAILVGFNRAASGTLTISAASGTLINGYTAFEPYTEYLIIVTTSSTIDIIGGTGSASYAGPSSVSPASSLIQLSGFAPYVSAGPASVSPGSAAMTVTGYAPTVGEPPAEPPPEPGGGTYEEEEPPVDALTVGPTGKDYTTISAAVAAAVTDDWILVDAGTYANDYPAVTNKNLRIRGVGGYAVLASTGIIPNEQGILLCSGTSNLIVENLKFTGASVTDENGAGIRYIDGTLTVRNCIFDNCENGILSNPSATGVITLENTDFLNSGFGDGQSHGIYIGVIAQVIVDGCYFYGTLVGHHLKSRALNTIARNCTFNNGTGETSRSIDLPHGGIALVENCLLQRPTGPYGNYDFIGFGPEGSPHPTNSLLVKNNVFEDTNPGGIGVNNYQAGTTVQLQGNVFTNVPTPVTGTHEYLDPDTGIVIVTLTDDV